MKFKILQFILLAFIIVSCSKEEVNRQEYKEQIDSVQEVATLTPSEVELRYSTYIIVKERFVEIKEDGIKYVKMETEIVNKTDKDILCIRGWIIVKDDYTGEEYCKFYVDCPKDIPANGRIAHTTQEYPCDESVLMHRKLINMPTCEFNSWITWDVEQIRFSDGQQISKKNLK